MHFFKILLWFLVLLISDFALAGPPFITNDPIPTPYKNSEFYLFGTGGINKNEKELTAPSIEYDYGLLPNLEVSATLEYLSLFPKDESRVRGIGDIELELMYQFLKETDSLPDASIELVYFVPTGNYDRGLGNGRGWFQIPIWLQKTCDKWTTYGGGGYAVNGAKGTKNYFFGGIVVERELNDRWTLGAEIYSQGASSIDDGSYTVLNLGGNYNFSEKFALLFSAGNNFIGARNFVSYLGFYWTW